MTGGDGAMTRVTRYQEDGSSQSLPNLNHGRYSHACGQYTTSDNSIVQSLVLCLEWWYFTLCSGVYRVRRVGSGNIYVGGQMEQLNIYRDPGEGRGQRLAAGGQPALGKTRSQWHWTGQWTVHGNWSVKFNNIDNIFILYIQHHFNAWYMAGGMVNGIGNYSSDILSFMTEMRTSGRRLESSVVPGFITPCL